MTFIAPTMDNFTGEQQGYSHYLNWHANNSSDNTIQACTFSIREAGAGNPAMPFPNIEQGCVWDIYNLETGWLNWPQGGEKMYVPDPSPSQPAASPGTEFKRCFKIPMAITNDVSACWEQASVGSFMGFCNIAAVIQQQAPQNPGKYPLIRKIPGEQGSTTTEFKKFKTNVPNFELMQWVGQPNCFKLEVQTMEATPPPLPVPPIPVPVAPVAPVAPQPVAPAPAWGAQPVAQPAAQPAAPAPAPAPSGAWNS